MKLIKSPIVRKNILTILAVPIFGYILWTIVFLLYALIVNLIFLLIPLGVARTIPLFRSLILVLYIVLFIVLSWFVFRSKLPAVIKAVYATAPLAVIYVGIGILTYQLPVLSYGLCGLVFIAILVLLYRTKQQWIYYYSVIFTTLTLLIFTLSGGEI